MDRSGGRRWLTLTAAATMTAALAACGSAAGSGKAASSTATAGGNNLTMWLVTTGPSPANTVINQAVSSFEKSHPGDTITINYIENQSYKQKIQLAMGAGNPPTIFWTWGGGPLKQFIHAGDVAPLGNPSWASNFLPSSLGAVTFGGQLYGVPIQGTQPVYFFYNKTIFSKLGLTFPATFSGLLSTVATLKSHGYAPISLANGDQWPGLMYLEYLTDRIGGPGVFQYDRARQGERLVQPGDHQGAHRHPAAGQGRGVPERLRLAEVQRRRLGRPGVQRQGRHAADGRLGRLVRCSA